MTFDKQTGTTAVAVQASIDTDHSANQQLGPTPRSVPAFLRMLFAELDRYEINYCVIHSSEMLPDHLDNDLDLAVDMQDKYNLFKVFEALRSAEYYPIQCLNHTTHGHFFVFSWTQEGLVSTAAVDIVFEHRRGGINLVSGAEMTKGRIWTGLFWRSSAEIEFSYLVAKKFYKGHASAQQQLRLRDLVESIGIDRCVHLASCCMPPARAAMVVAACTAGTTTEAFRGGRKVFWRTGRTRRPFAFIGYMLAEIRRGLRRYFEPTGVVVAVLGPDGVGKSTIINGLIRTLDIAFWRRTRVFHWRPNLIAGVPPGPPDTDPHGNPQRAVLPSMAYLFGFFLDHLIGRLLLIRPLTSRSYLIIFDRYLQDVLVDPKRYRYGGPQWFVRFLCRLAPRPDVTVILDADPEQVARRKNEVSFAELQRQSREYRRLATTMHGAVLVDTGGREADSIAEASAAVTAFMRTRFDGRFRGWLAYEREN